jgi:hypothetical protein
MKEKMSFRYFLTDIFLNIYKINFIPLIMISIILFLLKIGTYKLFSGSSIDGIVPIIAFLYYFLLHPGLLLLWNFNYELFNKSNKYYRKYILIILSVLLGYVFFFSGVKVFTGVIFSNNSDEIIIYSLIIPFDFLIILVTGIIETIKTNKNYG